MTESEKRENFIPYRKGDVVEMCIGDGRLSEQERTQFREFCRILESIFHFEFHENLEALKDCYAPFNPDSDVRTVKDLSEDDLARLQDALVLGLKEILEKGNYEQVSEAELDHAMEEESLFKIRLHVKLDDFEQIIFFRRGESVKRETLVKLWGLKKQQIEVPTYERVAIYVKFKDASHFSPKKRRTILFEPGSTILKLFRNIPKADIEMLFPNTEVRMKPLDKVVMGVPAVIGGAVVIATKLGGVLALAATLLMFWLGLVKEEPSFNSAQLIALGVGLAALAGFMFKQWAKYKTRKIQFMKALTDNLYFKNMDTNAGVFHHLVDDAEEEECKEAMLAYYFLLTEEHGHTEPELDAAIERWFQDQHDCSLDFEVGDALGKLKRLGLATADGHVWRAIPLADAKIQLDTIWDNYFEWNAG